MPTFRKIVVTGAAGFVGSHVAEAVVNAYPESQIVLFDKMTYASHSENVMHLLRDGRVQFQLADLCDADACVKAVTDAELIIHLAAESHVDNSFGNSLLFTRSNVLGTHTLAEAARSNNVGLFVHVSTDEVYGQILEGDVDETAKLNPTNPYSASKAAAEMILNGYMRSYKMPVIMVRANNIFGIRQFPEKIMPTFIMRMIHGLPLQIHGSGQNRRRYLAATDFAAGVLKIVEKGSIGDAYNIGSDEEFTNAEVANMICQMFERDPAKWVEYIDDRPFNDFRYAISYEKVKSLGWSRKVNVAQRLPEMVAWYNENQDRYPQFARLTKVSR